MLLFLTCLDDPVLAEGFIRNVRIISRTHLVYVNMLRPSLARPIFQSSGPKTLNDIYEKLGGHFLWEGLRETKKVLDRRGVGFSLLSNEKMCAQLVSQYLNMKQRQIL